MSNHAPLPATLRILVVDDMPAMRSILRGMLEEMGFTRIQEVEDAENAWQMVQQAAAVPEQAFGLVISDWNMPGMSGIDLLRAIRGSSHTREVPFLAVTAQGDYSRISEASQLGVTDYVVKPFNGAQLLEKIQGALSPAI